MPSIASKTFIVIAFGLALLTAGCRKLENGTPSAPDNTVVLEPAPLNARLPDGAAQFPPLAVAASNSARALQQAIEQTIEAGNFRQARWSVCAISLRDGRAIVARDAQKLMLPASNLKLYTTAIALDTLGANYKWRTSVYATQEPDGAGVIHGDLILYGRGAPDLSGGDNRGGANQIEQLAVQLQAHGIKQITGDIIGDASYFKDEPIGEGWLWHDLQWYFGAEISALSVNDNAVKISIASTTVGKPARVTFEPANEFVKLTNDTRTITADQPATPGVNRDLSSNEIRVWGDIPVNGQITETRLSVHQPALWAAAILRRELEQRGIRIAGQTQTRDGLTVNDNERFNPQTAREMAFVESAPLGAIVRATNKNSINLNAELIFRTLGKTRGADAPDPDSHKQAARTDDLAGAAFEKLWLKQRNIASDLLALNDGSGLSRLNLTTTEITARLLAVMTRSNEFQTFYASLPIAGADGTLRGRLRGTNGRIHAKTGTVTYANALSGYLTNADGEAFAFAIFCNDESVPGSSSVVIDNLVLQLANYRESEQ